ncbi:MAG: translocation/assembly module TamB domain-containing protein [Bacteroidales bacterium]|nr:translocation/assembly module TamB domain-containing protein [Bacteroidales bacterium]
MRGGYLRKTFTVVWAVLLTLLVLMLCLFGIMQSGAVQRKAGKTVQTMLSRATGLDVKVGKVRYFPFSTIQISEIEIPDPDTTGEWAPMVVLKTAKAELSPLSLFGGSIVVDQIIADSIGVTLRQGADGHYSIENIGKTGGGRNDNRDEADDDEAGKELYIGRIVTSHCEVRLVRYGKEEVRMTDLGVEVSKISREGDRIGAEIHKLAFDVPELAVRANMSAKVVMEGDTLKVGNMIVSAGASSAKIDTVAVVQDTAGIRQLRATMPEVRVGSDMMTRLAGRDMGRCNASIDVSMDSDMVNIDRMRASYAEQTFVNMTGKVARNWRTGERTSIVTLHELRTSAGELLEMLGIEPSEAVGEWKDKVGQIDARGKAYMGAGLAQVNIKMNSKVGSIDIDGEGESTDEWETCKTKVEVRADGDIAELTTGKVGRIGMTTTVSASLNGTRVEKAEMTSDVEPIEVLGHSYDNGQIHGWLKDKEQMVMAMLKDPNGIIVAFVTADQNGREPSYTMTLDVKNAKTDRLNITPARKDADLTARVSVEASGDLGNPTRGRVEIEKLGYTDQNDTISIPRLTLELSTEDEQRREIRLASSVGEGIFRGNMSFAAMAAEVTRQLQMTLPAVFGHGGTTQKARRTTGNEEGEIEFEVGLRDIEQLTHLYVPSLRLPEALTVKGRIESKDHKLWADVATKRVGYGDFDVRGFNVGAAGHEGKIIAGVSAERITGPVLGTIDNMRLTAEMEDDEIGTDTEWTLKRRLPGGKEIAKKDSIGFGGNVNALCRFERTRDDMLQATIDIDQSQMIVEDSVWTVDSCELIVSNKFALIDNLRLRHSDQYLAVDGAVGDTDIDTLHVQIVKMILEDIIKTDENSKFSLAGDLSAEAHINSMLGTPKVAGTVSVDRLHVNGDELDHLDIGATWAHHTDKVDLALSIVTHQMQRVLGVGYYDSNSGDLDLKLDLDSLSTGFLNFYLSNAIRDWRGSTSGKLRLYGEGGDINMDARLKMNDDNKFVVKQTGVSYNIDMEDSVILTPKNMIFKNIRFSSEEGMGLGHGVFSGNIRHNMYRNLNMNMRLDIEDMLVMRTTEKESPTYYGTVYGTGNMTITGRTSNVRLGISASTGKGTKFSVAPTAKADMSKKDYIRFKGTEQEKKVDIEDLMSSVTATMSILVTPEAEVSVVIDPRTDNQLTGRGVGNLGIEIDKEGELHMTGDYVIQKGKYNYSFENIISKQFDIKEGSTLRWNKDPYDAQLDVTATYKVKASLYDLVSDMEEMNGQDLKRRVPVECNIMLRNTLMNPDIKFDITIPSSQNFSQYTFNQYVNTEDEMNRQVFSLLLAGRFYAAQDATGAQAGQGSSYIGTTASELLSNQLSSLISQNKYNVGIGVNYRPGDEVTQEEYEVALSSGILNNKIMLSGNIGYGRDASGATGGEQKGAGQLIGDFDVEVKLNRRGNVRAKAYTHSNNDVIYETSPTTQGIGISIQEDFDHWRTLLRTYIRKIFKKK